MAVDYSRAYPAAVIRSSKYELMIMHKWVMGAMPKASEDEKIELEKLRLATAPFADFDPNKEWDDEITRRRSLHAVE